MKRRTLITALVMNLLLLSFSVASAQEGEGDLFDPDGCAQCHSDEYEIWSHSTHSDSQTSAEFIEAWARSGNPTYCSKCHATGYDPVEGTVDYEGVGCLSCHAFATETGVPHMSTDITSENCGTCHTGSHAPNYDQWLVSEHATMNIGCLDCHNSHDTSLRRENPNEQCGGCHESDYMGSVHDDQDMSCMECHMAEGEHVIDLLSGETDGAGHTFEIPSAVCGSCHGMTHTIRAGELSEGVAHTGGEDLICDEQFLEEATNNTLNLGLTGGGIGGLMVGLAVPFLLKRRRQS